MFDMIGRKSGLSSYKAISANKPKSIITEQYRKLRTNIELSEFNNDYKKIAITSTMGGEGKTTTCINLATVYSQSEMKTLLIDMDLRKPKVHRGFGLVNEDGLIDIIINNVKPEVAIHKENEYLHVLPAGSDIPFPAEFLLSKKLQELIDQFENVYDRIIIDTPPMSAVTDASIIGKFCEATIMVIASRQTNIDATKLAIKTLQDNAVNIIGTVLTRVKKTDNRYLNYYYSSYLYEDEK